MGYAEPLLGRKEITTAAAEITRQNVVAELNSALMIHDKNSRQIDYLYRYVRGDQPILGRKKKIRPEICNRVVENHAAEIAQFTSGYFLGEPLTYIRRGRRAGASAGVRKLNDYMFNRDKSSHDKLLATWMSICGVGYRMVLPVPDGLASPDDAPFEIEIPDPRLTFVVYSSGFGRKRMFAVREVPIFTASGLAETLYCGYTDTHYFEVLRGKLKEWKAHSLDDIPIFEYQLNMTRMGSFEPAVPLLDAINNIESNRVDGVEQFVQSFLKFKNCDIQPDDVQRLRELGAILVKSAQGMDSDVSIVSQELNQQQTQTLVDHLYDQVLTICGVPITGKANMSASDTGQGIFLRGGWQHTEMRARDTELLFKRSEKQFLRFVLRCLAKLEDFDLTVSDIECKFTRRQHDNLLTKTQSLLHMLEAGLVPEEAIATSGLFNDPMDVAQRSAKYLKKWDYVPIDDAPPPRDTEIFVNE